MSFPLIEDQTPLTSLGSPSGDPNQGRTELFFNTLNLNKIITSRDTQGGPVSTGANGRAREHALTVPEQLFLEFNSANNIGLIHTAAHVLEWETVDSSFGDFGMQGSNSVINIGLGQIGHVLVEVHFVVTSFASLAAGVVNVNVQLLHNGSPLNPPVQAWEYPQNLNQTYQLSLYSYPIAVLLNDSLSFQFKHNNTSDTADVNGYATIQVLR